MSKKYRVCVGKIDRQLPEFGGRATPRKNRQIGRPIPYRAGARDAPSALRYTGRQNRRAARDNVSGRMRKSGAVIKIPCYPIRRRWHIAPKSSPVGRDRERVTPEGKLRPEVGEGGNLPTPEDAAPHRRMSKGARKWGAHRRGQCDRE